MNGTLLARNMTRRRGQIAELMNGTAGVFSVLALSACVSAGAAYVALDYVTSPFADNTIAVDDVLNAPATSRQSSPIVQARLEPPVAPVIVSPSTPSADFADPVPDLPAEGTPFATAATGTAATEDAPAPVVRRVAGQPPVLPGQRPRTGRELVQVARLLSMAEARALPGPAPRPGTLTDPAVASAVEAAIADAMTAEAPEVELTAPGLVASLVPQTRPRGFAAVVASARRPTGIEAASGVVVARAAAPEVEITPARLEPSAGLFGPARGANPCTGRLARAIPNRPRNAEGGSRVMAGLQGIGGADRDNQILRAAYAGNVPDFLRNLRPVSFTGSTSGGREVVVTICVTPDYFAIGGNRDFVRVPLGLPAALQLADRFNMMLPTTRMVDAIYAQADLRLSPQPMSPGPQMASTGYFMQHDAMVDQQHARTGQSLGVLVAGHKKDVVLANRLSSNPGRVAIYGWHRASGSPIQPLSTVHGAQYADYSHGIRLVSRTAFVNGQAVDLGSLLTDARYAGLLNSDGPITGRAVQMAALR